MEIKINAGVRLSDVESGAPGEFRTSSTNGIAGYVAADHGDRPVTAAEVERIIRSALSELKVYVLESDITDAQSAVRAVVEKSVF